VSFILVEDYLDRLTFGIEDADYILVALHGSTARPILRESGLWYGASLIESAVAYLKH
jgi:hypothetical protein